jgi:chaperonin cofactor prefoldin
MERFFANFFCMKRASSKKIITKKDEVPATHKEIEEIKKMISSMNVNHEHRFNLLEKRFETSDKHFETMEKRFEIIDKRFETIDKRFEEVDKRFEAVDKRFEEVNVRFDELGSRMDSHFHQLRALMEEQNSRNQSVMDAQGLILARLERLENASA